MASQNSSGLTSQVYKSRGVILELMKKQGYDISDYEGFSVNEVNIMKNNNQLDMILQEKIEGSEENPADTVDKNIKKIYIRYYLTKSLRPNNLQEMIDDLYNVEEVLRKQDTLFIIVKEEVNDTLQSALKHIWEKDKIFIIIQSLKRLQFNILEHILVPTHRILSVTEKIKIKNKYNIMDDVQFPDISRFDPVAQSICIRPGQVCEIIRPSKTAITAPYYRICS